MRAAKLIVTQIVTTTHCNNNYFSLHTQNYKKNQVMLVGLIVTYADGMNKLLYVMQFSSNLLKFDLSFT